MEFHGFGQLLGFGELKGFEELQGFRELTGLVEGGLALPPEFVEQEGPDDEYNPQPPELPSTRRRIESLGHDASSAAERFHLVCSRSIRQALAGHS